MNKGELIVAISEKSNLSKKDAELALNALIASVEEAVVSGEKVTLVGFGTWEGRERAARVGRNPQNPAEEIQIPACKVPVWKAGKEFKSKVK